MNDMNENNEDHALDSAGSTESLGGQLNDYADWLERRSTGNAASRPFATTEAPGSFVVVAGDGTISEGSAGSGSPTETSNGGEVHEIVFDRPTTVEPRRAPRLQLAVAACLALLTVSIGGLIGFDRLNSDDPTEVVGEEGSLDFAQSSADPAVESSAETLGGSTTDSADAVEDAVVEDTAVDIGALSTDAAPVEIEAAVAAAEAAQAAAEAALAQSGFGIDPQINAIVVDGDRFVGVRSTFGNGPDIIPRFELVESPDGSMWTPITGSNLPVDMAVHRLEGSDGKFLAIGSIVRQTDAAVPVLGPDDTVIATSSDMTNWTLVELGTAGAEQLPDGLTYATYVSSAAVSDAGWLITQSRSVQPDPAQFQVDFEDFCGFGISGSSMIVHSCESQEQVEVELGEAAVALLNEPGDAAYFYSSDGQNFAEIGSPPSSGFDGPFMPLASGGGDFTVFNLADGVFYRTNGTNGWQEIPLELDASLSRAGLSSVVASGSTVVGTTFGDRDGGLARSTDGGQSWTSVDTSDFIDLSENQSLQLTTVSQGEAGWAVGAEVFEMPPMPERVPFVLSADGYTAEFLPGAPTVTLRSDDGSFEHVYERYGFGTADDYSITAPGLFGSTFFRHPETGELLAGFDGDEISNAEFQAMTGSDEPLPVPPPFELGFDFVVDDFRISGSFADGVLVVEYPDGQTMEVTDEWAFSNGDTSDGVELEVGDRSPTSSSISPETIVVYDAGQEIVRFGMDQLWNSAPLAPSSVPAPVPLVVSGDSGDFPAEASVPFSVSGEGANEDLVLKGMFPAGEIRLLEVESGTVLNSWDTDEDFDPAMFDDIVETADGFIFLEAAGSERVVAVNMNELLDQVGMGATSDLEAFPAPVTAEMPVPMLPSDTRSLVLFSPDGVSWEVISESTGFAAQIAVGDDEVLVQRYGPIGSETEVIRLGAQ